ncbi:MAG TPA: thioesterase family protein [Acidimicrobiales bacterium]|nr:thioesterase family protein [Acidimicrobiales bacterium]
MGDLAVDTAVRPAPGGGVGDGTGRQPDGTGRFTATLSPEWEIWGPMGGYVAAVALRAAGAASPFRRPATFACHYLAVARFEPVDLVVTVQRAARTALSQRVVMTQGDRTVLTAEVWSVGPVDGLEHHVAEPPDVPGPDGLASMAELQPDDWPWFPFWNNLDYRPVAAREQWPPPGPLPARWQAWLRFRPTATFVDPWVDAARAVVLLDVVGWPSAHQHHAWADPPYIAPSLDLSVAFHEPAADADWLLADGHSPVAGDGLVGWNGRLWSPRRRLVATAGGQALCRRAGA